ncbi:hypothetical protein H1P_580028 [Hyella patelloides LEGE 07179]|uniref:Uncharacterized protein n=1 Tax=Hyella patelloides LEGE 07179 TaxID=945734 RepID=A0A563W0S4_9CYAN|nr:hypothetical protein H1P_580028 [Hyella patelloides LEGE 07179]
MPHLKFDTPVGANDRSPLQGLLVILQTGSILLINIVSILVNLNHKHKDRNQFHILMLIFV